jgi:hypothetical protein
VIRAAGYFRVSSDAQASDDRNSLDAQRAAFSRHCAQRGYGPGRRDTDPRPRIYLRCFD